MPVHDVRRPRRPGASTTVVLLVVVLVIVALLVLWRLTSDRRVQMTGARPSPAVTGAAPAAAAAAFPVVPHGPVPPGPGFQGCPPDGDGGDRALNRLKNRADSATWLPTSVDAILALPWPSETERMDRAHWSRADAAEVARYEGTPVAVEGYLAGGKEEGPESPNCHGADHEFHDWHVWLSATPGTDRTRAVVVETTPVVRAWHPEWRLAGVRALARAGRRVRVSGWVMLDPEHPDQVGKTRGTIWEIHPVMAIDVRQPDGSWAPLGTAESTGATPRARSSGSGARRRASTRSGSPR